MRARAAAPGRGACSGGAKEAASGKEAPRYKVLLELGVLAGGHAAELGPDDDMLAPAGAGI